MFSHHLAEAFAFALAGGLLYAVARFLYLLAQRKKMADKVNWSRELLLLVFAAYIAAVCSQTILPIFSFGIDSTTGKFFFHAGLLGSRSLNLVPFRTILEFLSPYDRELARVDWGVFRAMNLLMNLVLFLPFGVLLPTLWEKFRSFKHTVLFAVCLIIVIESVQYFIGRSCDIDDLILNALGTALGYGIYCITKKIRGAKK